MFLTRTKDIFETFFKERFILDRIIECRIGTRWCGFYYVRAIYKFYFEKLQGNLC